MTIIRVQGNARGLANSGSTITVTLGSTPIQGNILICTVGAFTNFPISSITQTNVTWTKIIQAVTGSNDVEIWLGIVNALGASTIITVTFGGNILAAYAIADVCEYSGVNLVSPVDKTASNNGLSTTATTGTTATTTQSSELFIGAIFAITNGGTNEVQSNPTNSFVLLDGAENYNNPYHTSLGYLEKIVATTQTASTGTTIAQIANWFGCIATFKAALPTDRFQEEGNDFRETKFGPTWTT